MDNITRNLIRGRGRYLARLQARRQELQRADWLGRRDGIFIGVLLASAFWLGFLLLVYLIANLK